MAMSEEAKENLRVKMKERMAKQKAEKEAMIAKAAVSNDLTEEVIKKVPAATVSAGTTDWRKDKVMIKIHKMPDTPDPVFVGVNGETFGIKPGVDVEVPRAVLEALDHSTIHTKEYTPDPVVPGSYTVTEVARSRFAVSSRG